MQKSTENEKNEMNLCHATLDHAFNKRNNDNQNLKSVLMACLKNSSCLGSFLLCMCTT